MTTEPGEPYQTPAPVESKAVDRKPANWPLRGLLAGAFLGVGVAIALSVPGGLLPRFLGFDNDQGRGPVKQTRDFPMERMPVMEKVPPPQTKGPAIQTSPVP